MIFANNGKFKGYAQALYDFALRRFLYSTKWRLVLLLVYVCTEYYVSLS